jgi:NAD(P)-dependent dehydrogenase (short-subunit alcohol dehydrogenase family)
MQLLGRSAIITGASQGLGRAIATAFVDAGAHVLLAARNADSLGCVVEDLRPRSRSEQIIASTTADVSSEESCLALVEEARRVLPELTVLVNNAGIYGPIGRVEDNDWSEWVEAMYINCFGTILMCREVLPWMRSQRYGKIINLSGGGATAPLPNFSSYACSKAAVVRFTETLAEECKDAGIDVNAIAPGALNTRLLEQVIEAGPHKVGASFYARSLKQKDAGGSPPEKGAALAVFLASAASDGITGRLLSAVWDDWAGLANRRDQLAKTDLFTLRRIVPEDRRDQWHAA